MSIVLKVSVKNSCQSYTQKFQVEEPFSLDFDNLQTKELVSRALSNMLIDEDAAGESLDIDVKVLRKIQ